MELVYPEKEDVKQLQESGAVRDRNHVITAELEHIPKGVKGSPQNYLRFYYNALRRHDLFHTQRTKEDTLTDAITLLKRDYPEFHPRFNPEFFTMKAEVGENTQPSADVQLYLDLQKKVEALQAKKKRRAILLSVMRGGSTLMLFLSFGLLQVSFALFLGCVMSGCLLLGVSTFLEKKN